MYVIFQVKSSKETFLINFELSKMFKNLMNSILGIIISKIFLQIKFHIKSSVQLALKSKTKYIGCIPLGVFTCKFY